VIAATLTQSLDARISALVRPVGSERMGVEALSGTAREEAVGSPPTREGTMSITLRDPTVGLLDIPAQPLGPLPHRESDADSRPSTVFSVSSDGTVEIAHQSSFRGIETIWTEGDPL
jgi:hypothetical protein